MKANEENLLKLLDGTKQFILPIYQRRYSWEKEQCDQLWDDVLRVGEDENIQSHFLGSIVSREEVSTRVQQLLVIDGQQRLTTLSLLLSALGRAIEEKNADFSISRNQIEGYYLFNEKEDDELRYKQLLTEHDRDTLIELLEEGNTSDTTSLLVDNYRGFEEKLKDANLEVVYKGIQKLMIVSIALKSGSDEPQLIFESLNSTGLALSQADLIRNYVLMGQEHNIQTKLYQNYWYKMEESFGTEYTKRFGLFIRDFLTLKTGQIPNQKKVYDSFKRYIEDKRKPDALEAVIREIVCYSRHYVHIALLEEPDRELRACLEDINRLSVEVVFPFLLGVYEVSAQNRIEKAEVIEILRLVESYVLRRAICDIPTNTLNKTFAVLMGRINHGNYLQNLREVFSLMTGRQRFPSDNEFRRAFLLKDVYHLKICNYLLGKLENYGCKEIVPVSDYAYSAEHVMPQTLTNEWQEELGDNWAEVHEKYLHTIGNLTLTGYNSELGNASFKEKQNRADVGFRYSPLRLNRDLAQAERWDEDAISQRAEMLAEKACKVWKNHGVSLESDKTKKRAWTLADHRHLINEKLELFQQLRTRIRRLDAPVSEKINQHTIAYSINTIFVDVVPQAKRLRLSLNLPYPTIKDPEGRCKDVTDLSRWGMGDVEVGISSVGELEYIMSLIRQAYERQIADEA